MNNVELIRQQAEIRPESWRYGQAIFNYAYDSYPVEVNQLRGTSVDCFYQDNKVEIFLNELQKLIE